MGSPTSQPRVSITACTRFELASVSKSFTATAVLIFQERGLLSIDDDVRKFIPELPRHANGPLRIRDMLHQISGLTDYLALESVPKRNRTYWVNTDYLAALCKAPLDFPDWPKIRIQQYELHADGARHRARRQEAVRGRSARRDSAPGRALTNTFVYSGPASIPATPRRHAITPSVTRKRKESGSQVGASRRVTSSRNTSRSGTAPSGATWKTWPSGTRPGARTSYSSPQA